MGFLNSGCYIVKAGPSVLRQFVDSLRLIGMSFPGYIICVFSKYIIAKQLSELLTFLSAYHIYLGHLSLHFNRPEALSFLALFPL